MTASDIFNLYRAIFTFKNMQTSFNNEPVKIIEISRLKKDDFKEIDFKHSPGHLVFCKKSKKLLVKCVDSAFIEIKQLTIGKKKAMSAADFNNGFLKKFGKNERYFR